MLGTSDLCDIVVANIADHATIIGTFAIMVLQLANDAPRTMTPSSI